MCIHRFANLPVEGVVLEGPAPAARDADTETAAGGAAVEVDPRPQDRDERALVAVPEPR